MITGQVLQQNKEGNGTVLWRRLLFVVIVPGRRFLFTFIRRVGYKKDLIFPFLGDFDVADYILIK